jgi:hypothetical protein
MRTSPRGFERGVSADDDCPLDASAAVSVVFDLASVSWPLATLVAPLATHNVEAKTRIDRSGLTIITWFCSGSIDARG